MVEGFLRCLGAFGPTEAARPEFCPEAFRHGTLLPTTSRSEELNTTATRWATAPEDREARYVSTSLKKKSVAATPARAWGELPACDGAGVPPPP